MAIGASCAYGCLRAFACGSFDERIVDCADSDIDSDCTGDDAGSDVVYVGKKESGFAVKSDSFMLFEYDGLVLRNEGLHDAPANEIGYGTDTEDDHIGCGLTFETEHLEGSTLTVSPGEEHT